MTSNPIPDAGAMAGRLSSPGAIASVMANPRISRARLGRLPLLYGGAALSSARMRAQGKMNAAIMAFKSAEAMVIIARQPISCGILSNN